MAMSIRSTAFEEGGEIPQVHTCEGKDTSPSLEWSGVPARRAEPRAHRRRSRRARSEGAEDDVRALGALQAAADTRGSPRPSRRRRCRPAHEGTNDWKRTGYGGPCPPIGRHRYFFKLYALDSELPDLAHPTKAKLEAAMEGHVLEGQLMGTYQKKK